MSIMWRDIRWQGWLAASTVTVAAVLLIGHGRIEATEHPNFSGRWVWVPERTRGIPSFGSEFAASQTSAELVIDRNFAGAMTKFIYKLDGSESRNVSPGQNGSADVESIAKVMWDKDQLVIVMTPASSTSAFRPVTRTLSFESEGLLLVQTVLDPKNPTPVPSIYRNKD